MVMRSRPSNLAGASTVNVPRPPAPIATGRGRPSTVIATPVAYVGLPKASCADDRDLRAVSPLATTSLCVLGEIASCAGAPTRIATAVSARLAGGPAAIAVSATAPLPRRRGASNRKRASPERARAERVEEARGRAQRQPVRARRCAVRLDAEQHDLGEAPDVERGRRQHQHARERRLLQVDLRLARGAVVVDGARDAGANAGRHLDRDLDPSLSIGDDGPEVAIGDPHRHGGAGTGVERDDRRPLQRDARGDVHAARAARQLDDQQGDLRIALGRRQVTRDEMPGRAGRARHLQRSDVGEHAHGRERVRARPADIKGMGGPLEGPSAYFMKSPAKQYRDEEAHRLVEAYAAAPTTSSSSVAQVGPHREVV